MVKKILLLLAIFGPFVTYFFYTKLLKVSEKKYPIKILSIISLILIIICCKIIYLGMIFMLKVITIHDLKSYIKK